MLVSVHAVRRLKKRGLAPKSRSGRKAREYIRSCINKPTTICYQDDETGATVYVTERFTAIVRRGCVLTVYPNGGDLRGELREAGL